MTSKPERPPMGWPKQDELLTWAVAWRDYALSLERLVQSLVDALGAGSKLVHTKGLSWIEREGHRRQAKEAALAEAAKFGFTPTEETP